MNRALVEATRQFLQQHEPFSSIVPELLDQVVPAMQLAYFAKGEVLIEPASGAPSHCFIVKQGVVEGIRADLQDKDNPIVLSMTPGEIFPVGALSAQRPVSTTYRASTDVFVWILPEDRFNQLMRESPRFLDFCKRRMGALLDLSMQQRQARYAAMASPMQMMATPLESLMRRNPLTVTPVTPLELAFKAMASTGVGSILVIDEQETKKVIGIFTKEDLISRVILPQVSLSAPISSVMTSPVHSLSSDQSVAEAVIAMAQKRIRHIPILDAAQLLVGIVTERDLFALQRQSLRQISSSIDQASSVGALAGVSRDLRSWSRNLVAQGVKPAWVTQLISQLNDRITVRVLELIAQDRQFDLQSVCWLALGSEGRAEQTIATDQDNALILSDGIDREAARSFAEAANLALDQCGYPLCKGGIMAGKPNWCRTLPEWLEQWNTWVNNPGPQALVDASIFFDLRPLVGRADLAGQLRQDILLAASNTRFVRAIGENGLRNRPPASWTGGFLEQWLGDEDRQVNLKVQGSGIFVDATRVLSLIHGISLTSTRERFEALAQKNWAPNDEVSAWIDAFEFIQGQRLALQQDWAESEELRANNDPNLLDPRQMSPLDRRILKEAFRQLRKLQERLSLDLGTAAP